MARLKILKPALERLETRLPAPTKIADSFYTSTAWRTLVARLLAERGRACQQCGRTGIRIFGDHIQELKDGGRALDPANIQLLCGSCHTTKSAKARAERMSYRP